MAAFLQLVTQRGERPNWFADSLLKIFELVHGVQVGVVKNRGVGYNRDS